jgi:hypothetical protein
MTRLGNDYAATGIVERDTSEALVWPNFFVVGAVKCGTTSLYAHLKNHPQVFMPDLKEPAFFADSIKPVPPDVLKTCCPGDLDRYQKLYQGARKSSAIGDASPAYLWDEEAAEKIHQVSPHARIIMILRDPVERAYSHYLLKIQEGKESRTFLDALKQDSVRDQSGWWEPRLYIECGLYYSQVKRYLNLFGKSQVAVLLFEDLNRDPDGFLRKVANHLGIDPDLFDKSEMEKVHNPFKKPRFRSVLRFADFLGPRIRHMLLPASVRWRIYNSSLLFDKKRPPQCEESKELLRQIFAPDVASLEVLLGRQMPELRKSWAQRKPRIDVASN